MNLEFKLLTLKEGSAWLDRMIKMYQKFDNPKHEFKNEFVIVGEEKVDKKDYYKVQQLNESGICVFADLDVAYTALTMPKEEFVWDGVTYVEFNIPKKNITLDTAENIQRLNSDKEDEDAGTKGDCSKEC